jgi:hypothetical protein
MNDRGFKDGRLVPVQTKPATCIKLAMLWAGLRCSFPL